MSSGLASRVSGAAMSWVEIVSRSCEVSLWSSFEGDGETLEEAAPRPSARADEDFLRWFGVFSVGAGVWAPEARLFSASTSKRFPAFSRSSLGLCLLA